MAIIPLVMRALGAGGARRSKGSYTAQFAQLVNGQVTALIVSENLLHSVIDMLLVLLLFAPFAMMLPRETHRRRIKAQPSNAEPSGAFRIQASICGLSTEQPTVDVHFVLDGERSADTRQMAGTDDVAGLLACFHDLANRPCAGEPVDLGSAKLFRLNGSERASVELTRLLHSIMDESVLRGRVKTTPARMLAAALVRIIGTSAGVDTKRAEKLLVSLLLARARVRQVELLPRIQTATLSGTERKLTFVKVHNDSQRVLDTAMRDADTTAHAVTRYGTANVHGLSRNRAFTAYDAAVEEAKNAGSASSALALCLGFAAFPDISGAWRRQVDPMRRTNRAITTSIQRAVGGSAAEAEQEAAAERAMLGRLFAIEQVGHNSGRSVLWLIEKPFDPATLARVLFGIAPSVLDQYLDELLLPRVLSIRGRSPLGKHLVCRVGALFCACTFFHDHLYEHVMQVCCCTKDGRPRTLSIARSQRSSLSSLSHSCFQVAQSARAVLVQNFTGALTAVKSLTHFLSRRFRTGKLLLCLARPAVPSTRCATLLMKPPHRGPSLTAP